MSSVALGEMCPLLSGCLCSSGLRLSWASFQLCSQQTEFSLGVQTEAFPSFRTTFNQKQNPGESVWWFSAWSGSASSSMVSSEFDS